MYIVEGEILNNGCTYFFWLFCSNLIIAYENVKCFQEYNFLWWGRPPNDYVTHILFKLKTCNFDPYGQFCPFSWNCILRHVPGFDRAHYNCFQLAFHMYIVYNLVILHLLKALEWLDRTWLTALWNALWNTVCENCWIFREDSCNVLVLVYRALQTIIVFSLLIEVIICWQPLFTKKFKFKNYEREIKDMKKRSSTMDVCQENDLLWTTPSIFCMGTKTTPTLLQKFTLSWSVLLRPRSRWSVDLVKTRMQSYAAQIAIWSPCLRHMG